jgi:hypothetical protein
MIKTREEKRPENRRLDAFVLHVQSEDAEQKKPRHVSEKKGHKRNFMNRMFIPVADNSPCLGIVFSRAT